MQRYASAQLLLQFELCARYLAALGLELLLPCTKQVRAHATRHTQPRARTHNHMQTHRQTGSRQTDRQTDRQGGRRGRSTS